MKTKTVKQIGYELEGQVTVNLWGGGVGSIVMNPSRITFSNDTGELPKELMEKIIRNSVNDNGFGVESYISADVDVYTLFEDGTTSFEYDFYAENSSDKPLGNWRDIPKLEEEYSSISLKIKWFKKLPFNKGSFLFSTINFLSSNFFLFDFKHINIILWVS